MNDQSQPLTSDFASLEEGTIFLLENGSVMQKIANGIAQNRSKELSCFVPEFQISVPKKCELHTQGSDGVVRILQGVILDSTGEGSCCTVLCLDPAIEDLVTYRGVWWRSSPRPTQYPFWQAPKDAIAPIP